MANSPGTLGGGLGAVIIDPISVPDLFLTCTDSVWGTTVAGNELV